MRILVASSSRHRQAFYREAIEGLGDEVSVAGSGVECAESLRRERPNLLILETPLPWGGSDGVLAVLEELPGKQSLPVILVSTSSSAEDWFQLGRFRVDNFLFHVPTVAELHSAIGGCAARPLHACPSERITQPG